MTASTRIFRAGCRAPEGMGIFQPKDKHVRRGKDLCTDACALQERKISLEQYVNK